MCDRSLGVTTYALLTGFSPFGGDTDQETFCNISDADVDFPDELFEDVSADAVDFIRRLLAKDPRERPTARECLKHPWLANLRRSSAHSNRHQQQQSQQPQQQHQQQQHHQQHQQQQQQRQQQAVARRAGCNTCATAAAAAAAAATGSVAVEQKPVTTKRGLQQSYLSKSREALFERIVSKHAQQRRDDCALHASSNRLGESHASLVSRHRDGGGGVGGGGGRGGGHRGTRTFSKSKEKLYGLKSLSRSQDVLDMCKSIKDLSAVDKIATVGSLLMTLTGVSTLPNSLCSSTANISASQGHIPDDDDDDADRPSAESADNDDDDGDKASGGNGGPDDACVTAVTATAVTSTVPRPQSPAGSSSGSSVEHFYHSDEEPR